MTQDQHDLLGLGIVKRGRPPPCGSGSPACATRGPTGGSAVGSPASELPAAPTVNGENRVLRGFANFPVAERLLPENPVVHLKATRVPFEQAHSLPPSTGRSRFSGIPS